MLETINLKTGYNKNSIISSIPDLKIAKNSPLGIAGINGAGKTTFLKTIAGVLPILEGEIHFTSKNGTKLVLNDHLDMENFRAGMGYCPDVGGLIPAATPKEHINILLNLIPKHMRAEAIRKAEDVFQRMGLAEVVDSPCGTFSHGMMRRTSVALAYVNASEILILDEPFDGVDPDGVRRIQDIVEECAKNGTIVILSSHLINILAESVERILVMAGGNIISMEDSSSFKDAAGLEKYNNFIHEKSVR
jgi:ABC-2 type transport system ATP-binding protein